MLRILAVLVLCNAPILAAQSARGPRVSTLTVGLRQPTLPAGPISQTSMRRYDNNGWLIGAIAGAVIGGYLGHRVWLANSPDNSGHISTMFITAILGAAVGTVIGGVLGSR